MAWTTPKTNWATGELVTAQDMNVVGENLAALRNPSLVVYTTTEDIRTAGSSFADIDSDNLNLVFNTIAGGIVLVSLFAILTRLRGHSSVRCDLDFSLDGIRQGGDRGILTTWITNEVGTNASFVYLIQDLNPGSHVLKLMWRKHGSTTVLLRAGAQFWVREI